MILWRKLLFVIVANILTAAEILIDNDGGYKNIVVGITPDLPESEVESLLFKLETLFEDTSAALLTASKGNVFFKEIVFVIPRKYKNLISRRSISTGDQYFKKPDIFLTEDDVFINPYTVQNEGCGKPGLRIHIPKDFLKTMPANNKAILLVRQWAHYRYGVFDESGFSNDEIYPACYNIPGTDTIKVSDCTNGEAVYEFKTNQLYYSESTPNACSPVPVSDKNDHIVSSLMSNIDFPKMKYFCDNDTHTHDRNAPTKQNALCREQSAWEVISKHRDFKHKRKNSSNVKNFKYILEPNLRLVVAVDTSKDLEQNDRINLVKNAFAHFAFYNLPNNSTVGFMDMKNKEAIPVMESDAERLMNLFPDDAYGDADISVHRTIQRMLEVLKLDISDILLITATDIVGTWTDNIAAMLKSNKTALHVIYFQQNQTEPAFLEGVAKSSGGTFYYIAEAFPPGSSISSLTLLYEAFRSIYESFSWMNRKHVLVDQKTFTDSCSPKCELSFPTDRTIKTLQVLITGPNFGDSPPVLKDTLQLKNGDQIFTSGNLSLFNHDRQIPAFLFTIENPQPQLWDLTFKRRPGNNKPIVVIIRATNGEYNDILHMQSWISLDDDQNVDMSRRPPITVYSEIKKDNHPVIGAKVVAFIHQMSYNEQTSLELKDSGDGDPDITRNDGIFTRYLTDINKAGYHSITTVAERWSSQYLYRTENANNQEAYCCGSFVPPSLAYNSGPFKRVTTHQSFFVKSQFANQNYPPRRVVDLRVEKIEILKSDIKCYVLKWTAPGDNGDKGTAASYDIRIFKSREDALNNFDTSYALAIKMLNIQGPLLVPQEAGTIQTAYVEVTNLTSGTYFIGMKTISFSNKASHVSNLVEIFYIDPLFTNTGYSGNSQYTFPIDGTTETNVGNDTTVPLSSSVGLAIGLSCGILLLLIIIGIIIFIYCEKKRKNKSTSNTCSGHNGMKTESNDALCNSKGGGSISIISPVNSWGADSLISHFETLQKNKNTEMGIMAAQPNKETDTASFTSSKYSYDNKIDQNSLYDPIYYNHVQSQDELNYPYNTAYTPFNPIYTSSLRGYNNGEILGIPDPSDNASFYNYNPNVNNSSRLKTDV